MIAIDIISIYQGTDLPTNSPEYDRSWWFQKHYTELRTFLQECLDQGLILNAHCGDVEATTATFDKNRFYSTTLDKAQQFADKFSDMSPSTISIGKFIRMYGWDFEVQFSEVDFDNEPFPYEILPEDGDLFQFGMTVGTRLVPPT